MPEKNITEPLSSRVRLIAQAINNSATRGDTACLELAKQELERFCAQLDLLESRDSTPAPHEIST